MNAPKHLSGPAKKWWRQVVKDFELESHHVKLLTLAAESWDRCEAARKVLEEKGLVYEDRFGQPKPRPEVAIERDSRLAFARMLRELRLDGDDAPDAPRPPKLN